MSAAPIVKEIHVVGTIDNLYAQHLGVTFASALKNLSEWKANLYVISTGLTEDNRTKLQRTAERFGAKIQFFVVNGATYEKFITSGQITRATYLRIAIPDVLPQSVDRVLYLDSDIVVTGNLAELWSVDLQGRMVAAVTDGWSSYRCSALGIPEGVYFNNGVMVMDLKKWREQSISEKLIDYITLNTHRMVFPCQDPMNAILYDEWIEIDGTWNGHTTIMKTWKSAQSPAIIHYTDVSKPWHLENRHPFKKQYWTYLRMTEWHDKKPEVNLKRMTKLFASHYVPRPIRRIVKRMIAAR
jgi:lipopolysaccharide biosynthesis glycosyltransferase